jgi:hypothetical protein
MNINTFAISMEIGLSVLITKGRYGNAKSVGKGSFAHSLKKCHSVRG